MRISFSGLSLTRKKMRALVIADRRWCFLCASRINALSSIACHDIKINRDCIWRHVSLYPSPLYPLPSSPSPSPPLSHFFFFLFFSFEPKNMTLFVISLSTVMTNFLGATVSRAMIWWTYIVSDNRNLEIRKLGQFLKKS